MIAAPVAALLSLCALQATSASPAPLASLDARDLILDPVRCVFRELQILSLMKQLMTENHL